LSNNERKILEEKFCETFFVSASWDCNRNINHSVSDNVRFDRAFIKDADKIESIRNHLLPDRSLFVSNLKDINTLVKQLSIEFPVKITLQVYIEHLLKIKSVDKSNINEKPG